MTLLELETSIRDIIMTLVPSRFTVIWDDESGVRPKLPCITLKLVTKSVKLGAKDELRYKGSDSFTLNGQRTGLLSVNAFGLDAIQVANDLKDSLQLEAAMSLLRAKEISILAESDVRDLSELRDTKIEKRAQFDLTLGYTRIIDEAITPIESVEIDDALSGDSFMVELP